MSEPDVIDLPNIPAEYHWVERATCDRCGQPVTGKRLGSGPVPEKRRMQDFWELTCTKCSHVRKVTLTVPFMDLGDLFGGGGSKTP